MAQARGNIEQAVRTAGAVRKRAGGQDPLRAFSVLLMAVCFVVLMIGLVAGVSMYRSIAAAQERANDLDMRAGIVSSAVHLNDVHDALARGKGPEGDALVLVDHVDGQAYETRIYQYQGKLVQEYSFADRAYQPRDANELLDAGSFSFTIDGGLVTLDIDGKSFDLYVRSAQDLLSRKAEAAPWGAAAFLVESMLLLVFLAVAMAVFVQVFGLSIARASEGEDLSRAIEVASTTAERFAADPAKAEGTTEVDGMHVVCDVDEERRGHGTMYRAEIAVYDFEDAAKEGGFGPVYTVSTSKYVSEVTR